MTADALLVLQTLFGSIWSIFTSWHIPGTNTTPAGWFVFVLFVSLTIRFIKSILPGLISGYRETGESSKPSKK